MQVPVSMKNVSFQRITLEEKEIEEGKNFLLRYGVDGTVIRMDYLRSPKALRNLFRESGRILMDGRPTGN